MCGRRFLVVHKLAKGPYGITERIGGETVYKFNGEIVDFEGVCSWLASDAFDRAAIIIKFLENSRTGRQVSSR